MGDKIISRPESRQLLEAPRPQAELRLLDRNVYAELVLAGQWPECERVCVRRAFTPPPVIEEED